MSQSPVTALETILEQITQKLDKLDELDEKVSAIQVGQVRLEGEVKNLETQIQGISKRLDTGLKVTDYRSIRI